MIRDTCYVLKLFIHNLGVSFNLNKIFINYTDILHFSSSYLCIIYEETGRNTVNSNFCGHISRHCHSLL